MANAELDSFLANKEPPAAAEAEPPAQDAATEGSAPEPEGDDDAPLPEARPGDTRNVPLAALEGERKARQDWKEKAIRAETEREELRKQLEEAKRPPPAPPEPPRMLAPIDPSVDPAGYHNRVQEVLLNQRLDVSETLLRNRLGDEVVESVITEFKAAMAEDPGLQTRMFQARDPYTFAHKAVERLRLQRDVGDDPAAYRARIIAEERAKWEAEANGTAPPAPQRAGPPAPSIPRQPSLAGARSSAPRSSPAYTGDTSLADIFDGR